LFAEDQIFLTGLPVIHDGRMLNVQPRVCVNVMLWDTSPAGVWVRHTPVSLLLPQPIGLALDQQAVEKPFQTAELLGQKENTPQDAQKGQTSHPPNPGAPRRASSHARPQLRD
jgi:hypothetical protein